MTLKRWSQKQSWWVNLAYVLMAVAVSGFYWLFRRLRHIRLLSFSIPF